MIFGMYLVLKEIDPTQTPGLKQANKKLHAMDVLQQIIAQSAIGPFSPWVRNLVLSIFLAIVLTLLGMLAILLLHGHQMQVSFGY